MIWMFKKLVRSTKFPGRNKTKLNKTQNYKTNLPLTRRHNTQQKQTKLYIVPYFSSRTNKTQQTGTRLIHIGPDRTPSNQNEPKQKDLNLKE